MILAKELPTVDRIGLQSDAFALCKAGLLNTSAALSLVLAYRNETNYHVWAELISNFGFIIKDFFFFY